MARIQLISILTSLLFLVYISRLVIKNRLREEYSIVWLISTIILVFFSFYEDGLYKLAALFGIAIPANLVFAGSIFIILIYLLHLSVATSRLQRQNKQMAQDIALMNKKINELSEKFQDQD